MSKIVVETLNSNKKNQITLENCIFLKMINLGAASIFISFGGGEIEIPTNAFREFNINSGSPISQTMQLRYGAGTINFQVIRIEEDNPKYLQYLQHE